MAHLGAEAGSWVESRKEVVGSLVLRLAKAQYSIDKVFGSIDEQSYQELLVLCGSGDRFRLNVAHGDCSPIDPEALPAIRVVMREERKPHAWRKGDVLVLDNMLAAHG
jgi:hypothetical protein